MKWLLIVLFFEGAEVSDTRIFGGDSEESCKEAKAELYTAAKARGLDVWGECVEVKRPPPNKFEGDPKTRQKS